MLINNAVITGSFIVNGVDVTGITGSSAISSSYLALSSSYLITSASYAQSSASLSIRTSNLEATSSTLVSASSSFAADSASLSTRLTTDEANIATNTAASASFAAQSSSLSTRLTTDETNFTNLSSSFATTSGSVSSRVTLIEGQYATTGSNIFSGTQRITEASNAISFTSTASLYTDGGLRVSKDSYVSGTAYFNNVVVYGTSSIQYITSSQVNFGTNIITVNTDTPAVRFGGLAVFDSGSTQLTGSMLWDSEKNHWIYSNPSGSSYNSAMLMNGPRNTGSLGNEQGTTSCYLMAGQGGDHITSSMIYADSTVTCIPNNLIGSTICTTMANASCIGIGTQAPQSLLHVASGANVWSLNAGCACTPYNTNSAGFYTNAGNISLTNQFGTINWPEDYTTPSTAKPWWLLGNRSGTAGQWQLTLRTGYSGGGGLDREVIGVYSTGTDTARTIDCIRLSTGAGIEAMKINSAGVTTFANIVCSNGLQSSDSLIIRKNASVDARFIQLCNTETGGYRWDLIAKSNAQGCGFGIFNNTTNQYAVQFDANNITTFACTVCGGVTITAPTISAGSPTNSRIVANATTMFGYYDVETNYRWALGRDVWAGGAGGLSFGVGGTTTCYAVIGDASGYGCTIAFALLTPNGSSASGYEKMRLTTTGLVIGSATIPSDHILQVHNPAAYARMALTNNTTGVASGDGLIFQMEGTTGIIKNQEADSLKLGANGSETQLVLSSNGSVFIGNTGALANEKFSVQQTNNCALATVPAVARFMNNGSGYIPKILITDNNIADATISFIPAGAGTSTLSFGIQGVCVGYQYFNIKENGNIGIGTATPTNLLHLCKSSGNISLTLQTGGNYGYLYNDGTNIGLASDIGSTGLKFIVNRNAPDTSMIITSAGNVGIGISSPKSTLDVATTTSGTDVASILTISAITNAAYGQCAIIQAFVNDSGNGECANIGSIQFLKQRPGGNSIGGDLAFSTRALAATSMSSPTERMRILSNGFVGVATTSPKAVFDVACGNAHSTISTWCKGATNGVMYNAFDIVMDEASFAGQLYVQANGAGIGIQATYDVLASYDRLCIIPRSSMTRGQGETLTIPSYTAGAGSKRICIQQNNTSGTGVNISAMLIGTAYGGQYICALA